MNLFQSSDHLPPPSIIGRKKEFDTLMRLLVEEGQPIVFLLGAAGIGKSSLWNAFRVLCADDFPGGFEVWDSVAYFRAKPLRFHTLDPNKRGLLVVERGERLHPHALKALMEEMQAWPKISMLVVSREKRLFPPGSPVIQLGAMERSEWEGLLPSRFAADAHSVQRLYELVGGNPTITSLLHNPSFQYRSLDELFAHFDGFNDPGILGPDGRPFDPALKLPPPIVEVCTHLEAKLFEEIKRNPALMHTISPREFELFVAELLNRQGYDIEVTPPSRDGGVDIYAAKSDALGRFLFLVECKRYAMTNPVRVDVVRALHGNVQAKRATAGVLVTTSRFTRGAETFRKAVPHQLSLRDYVDLRGWINEVQR